MTSFITAPFSFDDRILNSFKIHFSVNVSLYTLARLAVKLEMPAGNFTGESKTVLSTSSLIQPSYTIRATIFEKVF